MSVVVTGGSGYIGRHVVAALQAAGEDVVVISRRPPVGPNAARWIVADLFDREQVDQAMRAAGSAKLIHLAWAVEHGKFWTDPANLDWVAASLLLVRSAWESGIRHVTVAGTCFEYQWPDDADCLEEATPTAPHTYYDIAKDACRRVLAADALRNGYRMAWARVFYSYGEGEHPDRLVASVARALAADKPIRCSRGLALRDWMDVRDVGSAIAATSRAQFEGAINIGSGESATVADIARRLGAMADRPDLVQIGALPDRVEPPRITADVGGLTGIGYRPRYTLDRGLADALAYWRTMQTRS